MLVEWNQLVLLDSLQITHHIVELSPSECCLPNIWKPLSNQIHFLFLCSRNWSNTFFWLMWESKSVRDTRNIQTHAHVYIYVNAKAIVQSRKITHNRPFDRSLARPLGTHKYSYGQWQWKCQNIWIGFLVVALCRNAKHSTQIQCNLFSLIVTLHCKGHKFFFFKKRREKKNTSRWAQGKAANLKLSDTEW